ncbi:hypothetical protein SKAU_G00007100 [Synaphobranchus kaupii]|uniref:Transmembrane protein 132C n=1 Tax=Synaphobranchus kaupii TaxID=118154 RepID=A0A9Q1JCY6_SYNKA|nr:hypothetical protein SKAU_G00007100 [Synaphobranchus kaupii]
MVLFRAPSLKISSGSWCGENQLLLLVNSGGLDCVDGNNVVDCRSILEGLQRFSTTPTYLPVTYQVLNAESSFFLKEANQDIMRNSSLQSRTEPFFIYQARKMPSVNASYGPLSVEQPVNLELLQNPNAFVGSSDMFTFNWKVQTFIINDRIYLSKPKVQVLFYVAGRDWDDYSTIGKLPCVKMFAFHETLEVRGMCRLNGELGLCVAELEPLAGWFSPPSIVPGRQRTLELPEGTPVELYYMLQSAESGDCSADDSRKGNSIRSDQEGLFGSSTSSPMKRIGSVRLYQSSASIPLKEQRLDSNFIVLMPSRPIRQRDTVTAYLSTSTFSTVEIFTLRVKLKEGVAFLGARPSNPALWMVSQDARSEGHRVVTLHCRRKESSYGQRVWSPHNICSKSQQGTYRIYVLSHTKHPGVTSVQRLLLGSGKVSAPYSRMDATVETKRLRLIFLLSSDFHILFMSCSTFQAIALLVLMSFREDEIQTPRYLKSSSTLGSLHF